MQKSTTLQLLPKTIMPEINIKKKETDSLKKNKSIIKKINNTKYECN